MNKKPISSDFVLLLVATLCFGVTAGIFASTLNNYLSDVHDLDASARGWLEFPRELPGFLILFVSAALLTLTRETKMAAMAMLLTAAGALGLGFLATETMTLVAFIAVWSLGDHIIFAVESPLGLKLAKKGAEGKRLGQLGAARNLGGIIGGGGLFLLASYYGSMYGLFYAIAAIAALLAGVCYLKLKVGRDDAKSKRIVFKKKYGIFYAISALFGVRKQIFLAFGGWVLVTIHGVPVETIALLLFISQVLGLVFRPLLGEIIDWIGEKIVLVADEVLLCMVCLTYAFSGDVFPDPWDRYVLYAAYILDAILFALRIARVTYLKKIADSEADITPTVSMGITIDHVVAMSLPILSGYIWDSFGFRWVFILAAAIAVGGVFVCMRIRIPKVKD